MIRISQLITMLALISLGWPQPVLGENPPVTSGTYTASCCEGLSDDGAKVAELSRWVKRVDGKLTISNDQGKEIASFENSGCGETVSCFRIERFHKATETFVVYNGGWEGFSYIIVNKANGKQITVGAEPIFSPDGKRFAAAIGSEDQYMEDQYGGNVFQIYSIGKAEFVEEYDEAPSGWAPSDLKWIDDQKLSFQKTSQNKKQQCYLTFRTKWILECKEGL